MSFLHQNLPGVTVNYFCQEHLHRKGSWRLLALLASLTCVCKVKPTSVGIPISLQLGRQGELQEELQGELQGKLMWQ